MRPGRTVTWLCAAAFASSAWAQTTTRVSIDSGGAQGDSSSRNPSISADGRYVAFVSGASSLVPGDTNGFQDVFVHDRQNGTTEIVSVATGGAPGDSHSFDSSISADGRYVAFGSAATNLVAGDSNGFADVFVCDRQTGTTQRVSVSTGGAEGDSSSHTPSISADGRYVAFVSYTSNLVPGDTNGFGDVFVRDQLSGTTERVSVGSGGAEGNNHCGYPSITSAISADGRYVVFQSLATNLVPGDTNGVYDAFIRDRLAGTTHRVSVATSGAQGNNDSGTPSISADGRYVVFVSGASSLVAGDSNGYWDVFVRDQVLSTTERVSVATGGEQGNSGSGDIDPQSISADGRYVSFVSYATNLVPGDTNGDWDIFLRDRQGGTTERVSVATGGPEADGSSHWPSISADGRFVAFESSASSLVPGDTNGSLDVFVRDRIPAFTITPFCFGDGTEIPCPCGNTGSPGNGCENSASTGGANLSGSGQAFLSADTLLLTASNERPTAFSLFWQGGSEIAPRVFGDGVGCMGPPLKRMYWRNAVGGVASAPQGADLSVSARAAALGAPIGPGEIRIYHVFYRDPNLSFCPDPLGATINVSSGLRVQWGS